MPLSLTVVDPVEGPHKLLVELSIDGARAFGPKEIAGKRSFPLPMTAKQLSVKVRGKGALASWSQDASFQLAGSQLVLPDRLPAEFDFDAATSTLTLSRLRDISPQVLKALFGDRAGKSFPLAPLSGVRFPSYPSENVLNPSRSFIGRDHFWEAAKLNFDKLSLGSSELAKLDTFFFQIGNLKSPEVVSVVWPKAVKPTEKVPYLVFFSHSANTKGEKSEDLKYPLGTYFTKTFILGYLNRARLPHQILLAKRNAVLVIPIPKPGVQYEELYGEGGAERLSQLLQDIRVHMLRHTARSSAPPATAAAESAIGHLGLAGWSAGAWKTLGSFLSNHREHALCQTLLREVIILDPREYPRAVYDPAGRWKRGKGPEKRAYVYASDPDVEPALVSWNLERQKEKLYFLEKQGFVASQITDDAWLALLGAKRTKKTHDFTHELFLQSMLLDALRRGGFPKA